MTEEPAAAPTGLIVLMLFVMLWSAGLTVGFGYAAIAGADTSGLARSSMYGLLAAFTGVLAARTGYELVRKLRQRRSGS